jgi:hypothetical protein
MAKTIDLVPEAVRKNMLKNTAVMEAYAEQIQSNISTIIDLINQFQESVSNDREQ